HGEPRYPQPLLAGGVELRELGDGGDLAQQPQRVEPPLLDRARRPRQLRGPAELALDLFDELADLGRGGFRLLALHADERGLVLLIVEEDGERAVGEERDADHDDEQRDVFGEQTPAGFRRGNSATRARPFAGSRRRSGAAPCKGACEDVAKAHPGHSIRAGPRFVTCTFCRFIRMTAFDSSCPGLTCASMKTRPLRRWIAGPSPAMTVDGSVE